MARNYVKVKGLKFHFHSPTLPGIDGDLACWGANLVDLAAQRDNVINLFNIANPGNDVEWTYPTDPIDAYILFDKPSVLQMLNWQGNGLYFYALSVGIDLPLQNLPMLVNPKQSPRYTGWKDSSGEVHKPTPSDKKTTEADFSGAQTLLDALEALVILAANLTKVGKVRDAGIVLYAYQQVKNQTWSITEAFDYLIRAGIVTTR
jgi:hypothetical protein